MRIVTAARDFIDIDSYAGCIAYAELLRRQGKKACAVSTSLLNASITPTVQGWDAPLLTVYAPAQDDTFTLIDISDPSRFDLCVKQDRVREVIDHHAGFEVYWQERLGAAARIEPIGAASTLVYETWRAADLLEQMSITSARLLICGILDNTLYFGAHITTDRDKAAYNWLLTRAALPKAWPRMYFAACQNSIIQDIAQALRNDSKKMHFATFGQSVMAGQLAAWDVAAILARQEACEKALSSAAPHWFLNAISIKEGRSYFITDVPAVQVWLSELLGIAFNGSVAVADRMWLRKEMIRQENAHLKKNG